MKGIHFAILLILALYASSIKSEPFIRNQLQQSVSNAYDTFARYASDCYKLLTSTKIKRRMDICVWKICSRPLKNTVRFKTNAEHNLNKI